MTKVPSTFQKVALKNGDQGPITLCVEPWANEYRMPGGVEWILEVEGPAYPDSFITVERYPDRFVAHAWDGSDFRLLDSNGKVLEDWTGIRVPDFHELQRQREQGR
jgi:hypothetical protein